MVGATEREAAQELAMSKGLIGKRIGMTTVFGEDGTSIPVFE